MNAEFFNNSCPTFCMTCVTCYSLRFFRLKQNGYLLQIERKCLWLAKLEAWGIFACANCKLSMLPIIYWPRFVDCHEVQNYTGDTTDKRNWFVRSSTWLRAFSENEFWSENYTIVTCPYWWLHCFHVSLQVSALYHIWKLGFQRGCTPSPLPTI